MRAKFLELLGIESLPDVGSVDWQLEAAEVGEPRGSGGGAQLPEPARRDGAVCSDAAGDRRWRRWRRGPQRARRRVLPSSGGSQNLEVRQPDINHVYRVEHFEWVSTGCCGNGALYSVAWLVYLT